MLICLYLTRLKDIIPQLLQSLPKLLVANLSFNILQSFPAAVNLATLAVLNLSFNKLTSLPEGLGTQLPALQQLYLTNNHLTGLPDSLAVMPLHDLFLSENALQQVPQVSSPLNHVISSMSVNVEVGIGAVMGNCI